jgi:hypothetical protein
VTYTVDVDDLSDNDVSAMICWCRETLGINELRKWKFKEYYFIFDDEKEYMWFKLRWE